MSNDWEWLKSTEQLQIEYYGNDLRNMSGKDRDNNILVNVTAAVDELHEALAETSWKPWSSESGVINREAFMGELVDTLHFVANLAVLAEISEDSLWRAYREKQQRNRERMSKSGGYQALKNKCPNCKRELDKPRAYQMLGRWYDEELSEDGVNVRRTIQYRLQCSGCSHSFVYGAGLDESLPGASS